MRQDYAVGTQDRVNHVLKTSFNPVFHDCIMCLSEQRASRGYSDPSVSVSSLAYPASCNP